MYSYDVFYNTFALLYARTHTHECNYADEHTHTHTHTTFTHTHSPIDTHAHTHTRPWSIAQKSPCRSPKCNSRINIHSIPAFSLSYSRAHSLSFLPLNYVFDCRPPSLPCALPPPTLTTPFQHTPTPTSTPPSLRPCLPARRHYH